MSDQISDPYLEKLFGMNPDLERDFFSFLLRGNHKSILEKFTNTPAWVIKELYESATADYYKYSLVSHSNFDQEELARIVRSSDTSLQSSVTHSPNISQADLLILSNSEYKPTAGWAKFYLAKANNELEGFILEQLNHPSNQRDFTFRSALLEVTPSDSLVSALAKVAHEKVEENTSDLIGEFLIRNPHLTQEHRVLLHLVGLDQQDSDITYSRYPSTQYILDLVKRDSNFEDHLIKNLLDLGHPLGVVNPKAAAKSCIINEIDLAQLMESEYLHRIFWQELCAEVEDFTLNFHNGYRVQDLFISHPTIGEEFDLCDFDDGCKLGGVIPGYEEREWVLKDEYLDEDRVESLLTSYADSLEEIAGEVEEFSELQPKALAYLKYLESGRVISEQFGFELTEKADEQIRQSAYEYAESDDYEIEVEVNPEFNEFLTWRNLSLNNQQLLLDSLLFGFSCTSPRLRRDSEHFLACIALHPATPASMIGALGKLDSAVVQSTLKVRNH